MFGLFNEEKVKSWSVKDPYFMHGHNYVKINYFTELFVFSFGDNIAYETKFEMECLISMNLWVMSFALVQSTGQSKK